MTSTYLFDLDDTIIDSSIYSRMHHELLAEIVSRLKMSEIRLQEHITELKEETGKIRPDSYDLCEKLKCIDLYYEILEKYARHTYSLKNPNIVNIFRKIKESKKRIGIVSNSKERTIQLFLDRFNLSQYVDFIESGRKETVLFWIQLEKRHDFHKIETLVIDDSDEVLKIAEDAGYKVMNSRDLKDIEKFD
jgi:FMN phosphatase YigB (HAD superfamily)